MSEPKNEPLVSVCVPVYNHENYINECLQSIIDQDYKKIELIVIDDGSKDSSVQVIKKIISACESRFVRFEFITRSNKGLCKTLNEAVQWSRGSFFSALASDDAWYPEKISSQIKIFSELNENVAAVSAELQQVDGQGNIFGYENKPEHAGLKFDFEDVIFGRSRIPAPAAIIRMSALRETGGYNEMSIIEDLHMWLSLTSKGYEIFLSPQVLAKYRVHDENTHKKIRLMHQHTRVLIENFSLSNDMKIKALKINLERTFAASAVYDKNYAIRILLSRKLNILQLNMISPVIFLITPKKYIPRVNIFGRAVKKFWCIYCAPKCLIF